MALKFLQSGKLLAKAFQNLQISPATNNLLTANPNLNLVRHGPGFFTKCKST